MSQLVEIVKKQLTQEYERQVTMLNEQTDLKAALSQLEQKYESLLAQVEGLETAKAPADLIALYIQTGGKVWISKKVCVLTDVSQFRGAVSIELNGKYISGRYADPRNDNSMTLDTGLYRLVVMAIPEEIPKNGVGVDDYGTGFDLRATK